MPILRRQCFVLIEKVYNFFVNQNISNNENRYREHQSHRISARTHGYGGANEGRSPDVFSCSAVPAKLPRIFTAAPLAGHDSLIKQHMQMQAVWRAGRLTAQDLLSVNRKYGLKNWINQQ